MRHLIERLEKASRIANPYSVLAIERIAAIGMDAEAVLDVIVRGSWKRSTSPKDKKQLAVTLLASPEWRRRIPEVRRMTASVREWDSDEDAEKVDLPVLVPETAADFETIDIGAGTATLSTVSRQYDDQHDYV